MMHCSDDPHVTVIRLEAPVCEGGILREKIVAQSSYQTTLWIDGIPLKRVSSRMLPRLSLLWLVTLVPE